MQNGYDSCTASFGSALDDVKGFVLRHASLYSVHRDSVPRPWAVQPPNLQKVAREPRYTIGFMNPRSVTPSELKNFAFCQRAWFLERQGAHSSLVVERVRGREDHESHGIAVQQAQRGSRAGAFMFALGFVGIAAAVVLWWLTR
jgi:hypothetical protein